MDQYELIRTAHRVYGKSGREIACDTGHSRNTVKKALQGESWGYRKQSHQPYPVLGTYLEIIDEWLRGDKEQPKKQRHTAHRVYTRLVEECDFCGSEPTVRRYVREAKATLGLNGQSAFIPLDPEIGREAEVDWGNGTLGLLLFSMADGFWLAFIGRILCGIGMSGILMGAMNIFALRYEASYFGTLSGVMISIGTLGNMLAATPLVILTDALGWRSTFLLVGGVIGAISVVAFRVLRPVRDDFYRVAATAGGVQAISFGEGMKLLLLSDLGAMI